MDFLAFGPRTLVRGLRASLHPIGLGALALAVFFGASASTSSQASEPQLSRLVITHDNGGALTTRTQKIAQMYAAGQAVAVPSGTCLSACTLYLGLPGTCVGPTAIFGFHGPTGENGRKLSAAAFETWSRIMVSYYPPALQDWFMREARFRTTTYIRVSGAELIRLGVPRCESA